MSTRTIVELNHDYLDELRRNGDISARFERWILEHASETALEASLYGVRVWSSRHHSESITLTIE